MRETTSNARRRLHPHSIDVELDHFQRVVTHLVHRDCEMACGQITREYCAARLRALLAHDLIDVQKRRVLSLLRMIEGASETTPSR
jgi:hypothetical protein